MPNSWNVKVKPGKLSLLRGERKVANDHHRAVLAELMFFIFLVCMDLRCECKRLSERVWF